MWIIFIIYVLFLSCLLVCSLQPCGHLLGKDQPLGSHVCDILLCFCHLSMWCPGAGVVLDCIDSRSLPPYLPWHTNIRYVEKLLNVQKLERERYIVKMGLSRYMY